MHTEEGTVYLLPLSAAQQLKKLMASGDAMDPRIAAKKRVRRVQAPEGVTFYSHQPTGIKFLLDRETALLADDMGLGKTLQTIFAAEAARQGGKVLIVCPAGLVGNWLDELGKWMPHASARAQYTKDFNLDCDFAVVSFDSAKLDGPMRDALLAEKWAVLAIDEAQRGKGVTSQRHGFLTKVQAQRVWQLSGMPMLNRPEDLFGLLRLGRHPLADDAAEFRRRFVPKQKTHDQRLQAAVLGLELGGWILRRYKDDVLDLPKKRRMTVPVLTSDFTPGRMSELMKRRNQLAQEKAIVTVEMAMDAVATSGRGAIVFSCFRTPLDMMAKHLDEAEVPYGMITGSVTGKKRDKIKADFQAGKLKIILGQIVAAGEGHNLTNATAVFFNDLSYIPAEHAQAEDRAYRIGQDSEVDAYYVLSTCPLDEALWDLLEKKRGNIAKFEDGLRSREHVEVTSEELFAELQRRRPVARRKECQSSSPEKKSITSAPIAA
jgi:SNF2 family DNA or RNA helicase